MEKKESSHCASCKVDKRQCQFEVLYDEALCQVDSIQRQVRHLRLESQRRSEDYDTLNDEFTKYQTSHPDQGPSASVDKTSDVSIHLGPNVHELKEKHAKELQKIQTDFQKERAWWKHEVQGRDVQIQNYRSRIAALEHKLKAGPAQYKSVVTSKPSNSVPLVTVETSHKDNDSSSASHSTPKTVQNLAPDAKTATVHSCHKVAEYPNSSQHAQADPATREHNKTLQTVPENAIQRPGSSKSLQTAPENAIQRPGSSNSQVEDMMTELFGEGMGSTSVGSSSKSNKPSNESNMSHNHDNGHEESHTKVTSKKKKVPTATLR